MTKLVAIVIENGKCVSLATCKNVSDTEYKKLVNQVLYHKDKELQEKNELKDTIENLQKQINELKHEVKVLKGEDDDE